MEFIDPDNIRKGLATEPILAYRYLARESGQGILRDDPCSRSQVISPDRERMTGFKRSA